MAIREASVILTHETTKLFNPVQFSDVGMMLASVILRKFRRRNDCSPVQWVEIDMMLASVI